MISPKTNEVEYLDLQADPFQAKRGRAKKVLGHRAKGDHGSLSAG